MYSSKSSSSSAYKTSGTLKASAFCNSFRPLASLKKDIACPPPVLATTTCPSAVCHFSVCAMQPPPRGSVWPMGAPSISAAFLWCLVSTIFKSVNVNYHFLRFLVQAHGLKNHEHYEEQRQLFYETVWLYTKYAVLLYTENDPAV